MNDAAQPLTRGQALARLRDILVDLFIETVNIRMVAEEAGLDIVQIDFSGAPIQVWGAVLARAAAEDKVNRVTAVAADHYGEARPRLTAAATAYAAARPDPVNPRPQLLVGAGVVGSLLLLGFLFITKPWQRIEPMSTLGNFNLAVARFPVVDASGRVRDDCVSDLISKWIFDTVRQPAGIAAQLAVDDIRGPTEIGAVSAERAPELAEQINATVVVYGVITGTDQVYTFQPAFYVRDAGHSFTYGSEIAGPNELGRAVEFVLPPEVDCDALTEEQLGTINRDLSDRLATLGYVITGLAFFFQEQYADASYWFDLSARQSEPEDDSPGQAIVQLLLGAARLREASPAAPATQAEKLVSAHDAFTRALEANPNYSRAYLGLGIVALEKAKIYAQHGITVDFVDPGQLVTARTAFSAALAAIDQPLLAYVPAKAALGIGIAHTLGTEFAVPGWSAEEAVANFTIVTQTLESSGAAGLKPVVALAYAYLGKLAEFTSDWTAMKDHCQRTVEILAQLGAQPDARTTAEAWGCVAIADKNLGHYCEAITDYDWALRIGGAQLTNGTVIPSAKLELWLEQQEVLRPSCQLENDQP